MTSDTPLRSVKYLRNNPISEPHCGHTKKIKPAPGAKQGVVIPSSSTESSSDKTSCSMIILFPIKRSKKLSKNHKG